MARSMIPCLFLVVLAPALSGQDGGGEAAAEERAAFLRAHCQPVELGRGDFGDLKGLAKRVRGCRLLMLGESNHGTREFVLHRNRLIRFLHEKEGFDLLLLESGIGEVQAIDLGRKKLEPGALLAQGLIGPWRNEAHAQLMAYLKTRPKLRVGGFDVQRSGGGFVHLLGELLADKQRAELLEQRFAALGRRLRGRKREPGLDAACAELRSELLALGEKLQGPSLTRRLAAATLRNRAEFLAYSLRFHQDRDFKGRFNARDRAMARNVLLWLEQLMPKSRAILIAHNYHIARRNPRAEVMGEILHQRYGKKMYTVAMFAAAGAYADNARRTKKLAPAQGIDDIQWLAGHCGSAAAFLPLPAAGTKGAAWLAQPVTVRQSFLDLSGGTKLRLRTSFDALLLLARGSVARYR